MPTHDNEETRKALLARQEALNDAAPATFDIANDIETAYRVAFLAAMLGNGGGAKPLEALVRTARELLDLSGYTAIRVRALERSREEAQLYLDMIRYNADVNKAHTSGDDMLRGVFPGGKILKDDVIN